MNIGDELSMMFTGQPVRRDEMFAEGQLRSAQTESAISQARARRAEAQTKERHNQNALTLADDLIAGGADPAIARQTAAFFNAGGGNADQTSQGVNNMATGARQTLIADPLANRDSQLAAMEANSGKPVERFYQSGTGMQADQMHPAAAPTVTAPGQAGIEADQALAAQRAKGGAGGGLKFQRGPGGVLYVVTGDPANPIRLASPLEEQMENATAMSGAMGDEKVKVKLRENLPKAKAALREAENTYSEVNQLTGAAMNDPSLWQTAGLAQPLSKVPGTEGVRLRSLLSTLKYRLGFEVLQNMRSMSPTGGALGNVSNAEGEWLQNSIVPLNLDMSVGDLREVLGSLQRFTGNAQARRRQAYNETFAGIDPEVAVTGPSLPGGPIQPSVAPLTPQTRVFDLPTTNQNGWKLMRDADGNQAYVNPKNPAEFQEVQ